MAWNYETPCAPVPDADISGFQFYRDQRGTVTARCVRCHLGFAVRKDNVEAMRAKMLQHLETGHGRMP